MTPARSATVAEVLAWYAAHARPLPWRDQDASGWGVMVSEFMLQQTPVARVLPVWQTWLARWPSPSALAAEEPGEAVRAWGRLGYPRRAQRLHAAACVLGVGYGLALVAGLSEVQRIAGPDDLAGLTAVYYAIAYTGFFIPAVLAVLSAQVSYPALFTGGVAVAICCLFVVACAWRSHLPAGARPASTSSDRMSTQRAVL